MHKGYKTLLTIVAAAALQPAFVVAQSLGIEASISAGAGATSVAAAAGAQINSATRVADIKSRAKQEIDRRIVALQKANERVRAMVHVSDAVKSSITASATAQISSLTALKATIDIDTSIDSLKTEVESITQSYRIFMLVIPQGHIAVATDKIQTAGGMLTTFSSKLQTRTAAAQSAGADVSALNTSITELNLKVASARAQTSAAVALTANLKPDNGDPVIADKNKAALNDARIKIRQAMQDLRAARSSAASVVKALGTIEANASASVGQ